MKIKILKNPSQDDLNYFLRQNYRIRKAVCKNNGKTDDYLYFLYDDK